MTIHPQVELNGIDVDEGIAPLLKVLWGKGMDTSFSCQGKRDAEGYILFDDVADAWLFAYESASMLMDSGIYPHLVAISVDIFSPRKDTGMQGRVIFNSRYLKQITEAWENR